MCRTKVLHTLLAAIIVLGSIGTASAQSSANTNAGRGWAARAMANGGLPVSKLSVDAGQPSEQPSELVAESQVASASAKAKGLTGTWRVSIPTSDGGLPPFNAYQTFSDDGTFTEVSDLLTTQTESPAHGVWSGRKSDYQLTFELFVFDPETKQPAGRVRVRNNITLSADGDSFTSDSVVDFITPDGMVIEGVDSGPFSGTRVKVVPISGT